LIGCTSLSPAVIADPHITEVDVGCNDYLIVASSKFWDYVGPEDAADRIKDVVNTTLASKMLQVTVQ